MLCSNTRWRLVLVISWVESTTIYVVLLLYASQSNSMPVGFTSIVMGGVIVVAFHQAGASRCDRSCSAADGCTCFVTFDLVGMTKGDRINVSKGTKRSISSVPPADHIV